MSNHSSTSLKGEVAEEKPAVLDYSKTAAVETPSESAYRTRVLRKIDLRLIPILGLLYAFNLIDRSNLGLIRIAGMDQALGLSIGNRYSVATCIFFVPTTVLELFATIYVRHIGTATFLSATVTIWGVITLAAGWITNWTQLVGIRFLLGILDAMFFPVGAYLITLWYKRREVQVRLAWFWGIALMISGFSPIIAYGLALLQGHHGIAGWRWIWIVEGAITAGLGVLAYFLIVDFPEKNKFLSAEETQWVKDRIEDDRKDSEYDPLTWGKLGSYVTDLKIWGWALCYMCTTLPGNALAFFLPPILLGMGYSVEKAELLTCPPFVVAAVWAISTSYLSDHTGYRSPFIILNSILGLIGLPMTAYLKSNPARYAGTFIALMGAAGNIPAILAFAGNNVVGQSKKAFSIAVIVGLGGLGGIMGALVFRQQDAPDYRPGFICTVTSQAFILVCTLATAIHFYFRNKAARAGGRLCENTQGFLYTI